MQLPNTTFEKLAKNPDALLTVREVAYLLSMSEAWVRHHASGFRKPSIPCVKLGSSVRFRRQAVMEFVASMEQIDRGPISDAKHRYWWYTAVT